MIKQIRKLIILSIAFLFVYANICGTAYAAKTVKKTVKKQTTTVKKPTNTLINAKNNAFKNVQTTLPLSYYKADMTDKYYNSNMAYLQQTAVKQKNEPARQIYTSYCGNMLISYGIRYEEKPDNIYHYNTVGKLMRIEIDNNNPSTYPKKTITYNNLGKLQTVVYYVSQKEQYNFNGSGTLIVHWIGEKAYNRDGKLMRITRSL